MKGNRFIRPHLKDPRKLPIAWNMDPSVVIWLTQCSGIHFEGNTVSDVGPFAETIIDKTATAQTLGEEDGVKVTRWLK